VTPGALDVTGTVTADGLTVQTTNGLNALLESTTSYQYLQFKNSAETNNFIGFVSDDFVVSPANNQKLIVTAEGNVGIGTSPSTTLEIANTGNGTAGPILRLTNPDVTMSSNQGIGAIEFFNSDATGSGARVATNIQSFAANTSGGGYLTFGVSPNAGTVSEAMRLDASGNLLVGTTNAAQDSGDGVKIKKDGTQGRVFVIGSSATSGEGYSMHANGSFRFYVQYSGQINSTSQSILGISDVSLKENIRDLDRGLEAILALQPRRFDWKNGDGNDIMGFVAQEVETVLPELVHDYKYDSEETKLGLKMGDMIPSLVKAIQEQQETITALTARIEQLENN
jgi:hypothetical protein